MMFATKSIRSRSCPNVETDRLIIRMETLREMFRGGYTPVDTGDDGRNTFRARVRETMNIERELLRRGVMFRPVTDGAHLRVDVFAIPRIVG